MEDTKQIPKTLDELKTFGYDVDDIYHNVRIFLRDEINKIERVKRMSEPSLKTTTPTKSEMDEYQNQLKEYKSNQRKYKKYWDQVAKIDNSCNHLFVELVKEDAEFHLVPKKYQQKVWDMAWELGHSFGYSEVHMYLLQLVEIFK